MQAGKFAAIEFLVAAVLDMGFRIGLIMAGQTNHLRRQAEGRTAVLVGDFNNQLDMDEMMNDHITWLTSSVDAKIGTDVDANFVSIRFSGVVWLFLPVQIVPLSNFACVHHNKSMITESYLVSKWLPDLHFTMHNKFVETQRY